MFSFFCFFFNFPGFKTFLNSGTMSARIWWIFGWKIFRLWKRFLFFCATTLIDHDTNEHKALNSGSAARRGALCWLVERAVTSAHLQSDDPLVDVLPHAHLHIELGQALVRLSARRSHILTGRHVLREVQHVPLDWQRAGQHVRGGVRPQGEKQDKNTVWLNFININTFGSIGPTLFTSSLTHFPNTNKFVSKY